MTTEQTEALIGMTVVVAILVLLTLPSALGIIRDRRIDRQIREAQEAREERGSRTAREDQKSSSRSTVPSTATWYAEGRRSKKLVSS
jgi:type II secretory pathway pseudopilin PulG